MNIVEQASDFSLQDSLTSITGQAAPETKTQNFVQELHSTIRCSPE